MKDKIEAGQTGRGEAIEPYKRPPPIPCQGRDDGCFELVPAQTGGYCRDCCRRSVGE